MGQPVKGTSTSSSSSSTNSLSYSCTVSSGQNFLTVQIGTGSGSAAQTASGVTFNGTALTREWGPVSDGNWDSAECWYLANPSVGTFNVVVTLTGSAQVGSEATPWSGVDLASPFGTAVTNSSAGAGPATTGSVTSDANSIVIGCCQTDATAQCDGDGTVIVEINNIATDTSFASQYKTTAPATLNWTIDENGWACGAVSLHGTSVSPTLEQEGWRWRNDDGSESGATWKAAQDTDGSLPANTAARIRVIVNASGDPASDQYQLEWRKVGDSTWRKVE